MEMEDNMATLLNDWMQGLFFSFSCKFYLFTTCLNSRIKLNVLFECKFHFPIFWNNTLVSICLIMYFFAFFDVQTLGILWMVQIQFFFYFVVVFWGAIRWNRFTIFFFVFFDVQTLEKAPLESRYRLPHNF